MYLVAIGWMYVVGMMALAEALSPQGTVLGAFFTFVLYGCAPLAVVMYLLATPMRRRAPEGASAASTAPAAPTAPVAPAASAVQPDGGSHAAGAPVPPVREEP